MLAVGDTNDVHLFEAIGGGREFRKIGTYKGEGQASGWCLRCFAQPRLFQAQTTPDSPPRGARTGGSLLLRRKVRRPSISLVARLTLICDSRRSSHGLGPSLFRAAGLLVHLAGQRVVDVTRRTDCILLG